MVPMKSNGAKRFLHRDMRVFSTDVRVISNIDCKRRKRPRREVPYLIKHKSACCKKKKKKKYVPSKFGGIQKNFWKN